MIVVCHHYYHRGLTLREPIKLKFSICLSISFDSVFFVLDTCTVLMDNLIVFRLH